MTAQAAPVVDLIVEPDITCPEIDKAQGKIHSIRWRIVEARKCGVSPAAAAQIAEALDLLSALDRDLETLRKSNRQLRKWARQVARDAGTPGSGHDPA